MVAHIEKISDVLADPDTVVKSRSDEEVSLYHKHYSGLSIGDKVGLVRNCVDS